MYEVIAYAVIDDPLDSTVFHCELRIPEAQYEIRKSFIYYPGEYNALSFYVHASPQRCSKENNAP